MTEERIVHCRKLNKDLPGLKRQPYRNELGRRIYEEVSQEAWDMWLKDSVKYINTYCGPGSKYDLATPEGQKFMFDQVAIYFGFEQGELAKTAFTPKDEAK
ncbi:MAG TPA: Fe(2+)-trafficking protein [Polyangiaceae bacterium]